MCLVEQWLASWSEVPAGSWCVCILISCYAISWQDIASSSQLSNRNFVWLSLLHKRKKLMLEHPVIKVIQKKELTKLQYC
jgi:hypothetical protein